MSRLAWFGLGALTVVGVEAIGIGFVLSGAQGFSARARPGAIEGWAARQARSLALPAGVTERTNPSAMTPQVLGEARDHWADHCALCHANDGSGENTMGLKMFPPVPDMRKAGTQNLSDGELFFIIQNGVRHTGMPAWADSGHDEEASWKLVRFIRHLPDVSFEEKKAMERTNPKTAGERQEEADEEKFLKGQSGNAPIQRHHH